MSDDNPKLSIYSARDAWLLLLAIVRMMPSILNSWKSLRYVLAYRSPSILHSGKRTDGISTNLRPIIAAHCSSVREGSPSSLIVAWVVLIMTSAVSASVPSKSSMTILTGDICFSFDNDSISEFLADFEAFVYRNGDLLFDLFRRAVVHVLRGNDRQSAPSPKMRKRLDVRRRLFQRVSGHDVHAACRYIHDLLCLAQTETFLVIAVKCDPEQRHVLKEHLQCTRETHIPERRSNHNPVSHRNPSRKIRMLQRNDTVIALLQYPVMNHRILRLPQVNGLNHVSFRKRLNYPFSDPPGPRSRPHAGVYVYESFHGCFLCA